jgi:hypothetical protein
MTSASEPSSAPLACEKGMYLLTTSQSIELAYESEALRHGYTWSVARVR